MKITILGAGSVGGTLAQAWAARGHEIFLGVRDPRGRNVKALLADNENIRAGDMQTAIAFADVILIAIPWRVALDVVGRADDLEGKVLVDATNALEWENGPVASLKDGSVSEALARLAPESHVVKAFNTIGAELMADPMVAGTPTDMFLCGTNQRAKAIVSQLAAELGFVPVDAGPLRNARHLESMAILWIHLATVGGHGRDIAFKLLEAGEK